MIKKQTGSRYISFGEFLEELKNTEVVIPLIQRNYKWHVNADKASTNNQDDEHKGSEGSAEELFNDIIKAIENNQDHTMGMATLYVDDSAEKPVAQILDGQQRMITLSLLAKALGKYDEFPRLKFERDENQEREKYLAGEESNNSGIDVFHMETTYKYFCYRIGSCEKTTAEIFKGMKTYLKLICRYTENEPLNEFLSLNDKKTAFCSTDYDRAYQLKYQSAKQEITPEMILKEHSEIQKYLYTNSKIFELINKGYPEVFNRMDLIFSELFKDKTAKSFFDTIDHANEEEREQNYRKCFEYLKYCHKVLRSIHQEIREKNGSILNVNIYNAVQMLYEVDEKFRFFQLLDWDDNSDEFERKIAKKFSLYNNTYKMYTVKDAFMQSQLSNDLSINVSEAANFTNSKVHFEKPKIASDGIVDVFSHKVTQTESILELAKNYSELVAGGKKSFFDILNLPEIKQIIVPSIQRDYTFGSQTRIVEKNRENIALTLMLDISKNILTSSLSELKTDTFFTKYAIEYLRNGKLWQKIENLSTGSSKNRYMNYEAIYNYWGNSITKCDFRRNKDKEQLMLILEPYKKLNLTKDEMLDLKENKLFKFSSESDFLFSVIFGYLEDGNFYLYDGQQRMVTMVYLCAYLFNQGKYLAKDENDVERYKKALSKFKFQNRKEANDLLIRLLDPAPIAEDELNSYIVDHSTYSIVELIRQYNSYENGYEKSIMMLDPGYLMNHILFEFALVGEASIADQMYMDLNSKNVPLTPYEIYKAELIYNLSKRFSQLYEKDWKLQLDNSFLNQILALSKNKATEWTKTLSDKIEEIEIKMIHWCFTMAAMEYGISVGAIDDKKNRFSWMQEPQADKIVELVGGLLNSSKQYKDVTKFVIFFNNKEMFDKPFGKDSMAYWSVIAREMDESISITPKNRFIKKGSRLQVYFSGLPFEAFWEYFNTLFGSMKKYANSYPDKNISDDDICKFLLMKFHTLYECGYLETDILEDIVVKEFDYYSENHLNGDNEFSTGLEWIYSIKLNERLDVEQFSKVREWEKYEYKNSEPNSITNEQKQKGKDFFEGDYLLMSHWEKALKISLPEVCIEMHSGTDCERLAVAALTDEHLKKARLDNVVDQKVTANIKLKFADNSEMIDKVKSRLLGTKPEDFKKMLDQIKTFADYYIEDRGNGETHEWHAFRLSDISASCEITEVTEIVIGKLKVGVSEFSDDFMSILNEYCDNLNDVRYNWLCYLRDKDCKKLKDQIGDLSNMDKRDRYYEKARNFLGQNADYWEQFRQLFEEVTGYLPN